MHALWILMQSLKKDRGGGFWFPATALVFSRLLTKADRLVQFAESSPFPLHPVLCLNAGMYQRLGW